MTLYTDKNKVQFLICVADVSGKGIPAALMMSNFQASLRTLLRQTPNLKEIVEALNYQVMENTKGEKFITFFGAIYDLSLITMILLMLHADLNRQETWIVSLRRFYRVSVPLTHFLL
ncbi:MAG: SpoIIE family protein phosphatase [Cytophagales bacterium]|nr:SpoIIE family protein phosphatase [Cytophagales bacterium]